MAVLFVSWRAGSKAEEHPGYPGFLLAAGLSSCLASLTMGFISFVKLGAVCPFCVSLYGLSAILLWAGWRASGERLPGEGLMKRLSLMGGGPSLGSGVVAFLVSVVVLYIGFTPDDDVVKAGDVLTNVDLVGDEPSKGNPDAAYVVMEFADFQCPGCAHLHPEMDELIRGNDDIRLIFKHLPLEMHEYAFLAAKGAVCAHQQDKFWDMSDLIFSNQKTLNKQSSEFAVRELLKFWAGPKQLGLDLPAFSACLSAEATSDRVNADIAAAETMEIKGTPAVFLEGVCGPGQWVRIDNRIPGVLAAIEAHKTGATLPFSCAPAAEETDAETDADPALSSSSTAPQE